MAHVVVVNSSVIMLRLIMTCPEPTANKGSLCDITNQPNVGGIVVINTRKVGSPPPRDIEHQHNTRARDLA